MGESAPSVSSEACSAFSFEAEFARQSGNSAESAPLGSAAAKAAAKAARHDVRAGCKCRLCEEDCASGSQLCWNHKRGQQNIYKQAFKAKAKPAPANKLWTEYTQIFGEGRAGPTNQALADQVLMDYVAQFPDGGKKSAGARRGAVNLGHYSHKTGSRASEEEVVSRAKWDYELFESQMKLLRSWTPQQSRDHWRELESNPDIARDAGGPKGAMRLSIPSNLTGNDRDESRAGRYEERAVVVQDKARAMTADDRASLLAETRSGFDLAALASPNAKQNMSAPLPASAAAASEADILKGIFTNTKTGELGAAPHDAVVPAVAAPETPVTPVKPSDISRGRAKLWAAIRADLDKFKPKMHAELKASKVAIDNSKEDDHGKLFITPVVERHSIAMAFMGVTLTVDKKTEEEVTNADHVKISRSDFSKSEQKDGRCADHDALILSALESASILPMESAALMSWTSLEAFQETVQHAGTEKALEEKQNEWDSSLALMNQLLVGLRTSTRELSNEIKKRAAGLKKLEEQEKKKRELELVDKKKSEERAAKKRLVHEKEQVTFNVEFQGHPEVVKIPDDEEFKKQVKTSDFFALPWQLEASKMLSGVLAKADGNTLHSTLARWHEQFQKSSVYVQEDVVGSPLLPAMGSDELKPLLDMLAPMDQRIANHLPSYQAVVGETKLLGESPTHVFKDFGTAFLGTMRVQVQGTSRIFMVSFDSFRDALIKIGKMSQASAPLANLWEVMKGVCNAADLQELTKHGCQIYHCNLAAEQVLWIPAGWFHVVSTCNGQPVSAVKRSFAMRGALDNMEKVFSALKGCEMSKASMDRVDTFLDILAIERAGCQKPQAPCQQPT